MTSRVRRAAGVALLAVALAGCGAGPDSLTSVTVPSVPGLNVSDTGVLLRNVAIPYAPEGYPAGATLPITMVVANDTRAPVSLTSVASPAAATVAISEDGDATVPAAGSWQATVILEGLRADVHPFDVVPLELTFDNGASFQLDVPVAPPEQRVGEREPILAPEGH